MRANKARAASDQYGFTHSAPRGKRGRVCSTRASRSCCSIIEFSSEINRRRPRGEIATPPMQLCSVFSEAVIPTIKAGLGRCPHCAGLSTIYTEGHEVVVTADTRPLQEIVMESHVTTDHNKISHWVEERGGCPAAVKATESKNDVGILRINFPNYGDDSQLEDISCDEFFEMFEEKKLAFLYQDKDSKGHVSRFNKLVSRDQLKCSAAGGGDLPRPLPPYFIDERRCSLHRTPLTNIRPGRNEHHYFDSKTSWSSASPSVSRARCC